MALDTLIRKGSRYDGTNLTERFEHYWIVFHRGDGSFREDFHIMMNEYDDSGDELASDKMYFRFLDFKDAGDEL